MVVVPGTFTTATMPPAALFPQFFAWNSDIACFMQSDGSQWKTTSYTFPVGIPNTRTISPSTAYQATDPTRAALVTINLSSTASISLLNQTQASQKAQVWVAANASDVLSGTGTAVALGNYENTQSGTLVATLVLNQTVPQQSQVAIPAGWYFAVKQTTGANLVISSAFDQAIG